MDRRTKRGIKKIQCEHQYAKTHGVFGWQSKLYDILIYKLFINIQISYLFSTNDVINWYNFFPILIIWCLYHHNVYFNTNTFFEHHFNNVFTDVRMYTVFINSKIFDLFWV